MSYTDDFKIKDALQSLYGLGKLISNNVYTGNRPQATPDQMKDFVVVSIPSTLESATYGSGFGIAPSYCNFEIFVKLKKGGFEDLNKVDNMLNGLFDIIPFKDEVIQITNPKVKLKGNDGLGFSAVLVRAELLLK